MKLIMAILIAVSTSTLSAKSTSTNLLDVQQKDGSLIFRIPESVGEVHDVVVTSETGSKLGVSRIASNTWRVNPARAGHFSGVVCTDRNCSLVDYDWEVENYVEPKHRHLGLVLATVIFIILLPQFFKRES